MLKKILMAASLTALAASGPSIAAPCKDPKTGKFVKCPEKGPAKPTRCKDSKGKFAKCGTPGAKPA
jgi:hypothetical protein